MKLANMKIEPGIMAMIIDIEDPEFGAFVEVQHIDEDDIGRWWCTCGKELFSNLPNYEYFQPGEMFSIEGYNLMPIRPEEDKGLMAEELVNNMGVSLNAQS